MAAVMQAVMAGTLTGFADAVDALYALLDLPAPLRSELSDGRLELSVGDALVSIEAVGARAVLVRAPLDTLDADPVMREREAADMLRDCLALATTSVASLRAEPGAGGAPPLVWAEALVALGAERRAVGAALKTAIEDVVERTTRHGERASDGRPATMPHPAAAETGHVIFRP